MNDRGAPSKSASKALNDGAGGMKKRSLSVSQLREAEEDENDRMLAFNLERLERKAAEARRILEVNESFAEWEASESKLELGARGEEQGATFETPWR